MTTVAAMTGLGTVAAQAADYTPPPPMPSVFNWTGLYFGGHIGWAWLETGGAQGPQPGTAFIQKDSDGVMGGGHVGFNFEIAPSWVIGIEGDFSATDLDKTVPCNNPIFNCNAGADWTASLRGRAGYAFERVLLYGTGGVAWLDYDGFTSLPGVKFKDSDVLTGWTVGGGVEWAWTDNIILRGEYRYSNFESATMTYDIPYPINPELHIARFGVSFKF